MGMDMVEMDMGEMELGIEGFNSSRRQSSIGGAAAFDVSFMSTLAEEGDADKQGEQGPVEKKNAAMNRSSLDMASRLSTSPSHKVGSKRPRTVNNAAGSDFSLCV